MQAIAAGEAISVSRARHRRVFALRCATLTSPIRRPSSQDRQRARPGRGRRAGSREENVHMAGSEEIVIVGPARTPVGSFGGAFGAEPAHELGATAIKAALER